MEYIFHIGPHKTGSTYLQNSFCTLRLDLAKRGVVYPEQWQSFLTGHHALARELRAKSVESLRAGFQGLSAEHVVLFSSEEFSLLEQPELLLLKEIIGANRVRFIFYCRRWSDLLPSSWQEDVKQGSGETLPEFYLPRLADPLRSNIINFSLVLDRFATVFGEDAVQIVSYSNLLDQKEDLVRHFVSEILDIRDGSFAFREPDFPNSSLDYFDVEIIRVLNIIDQQLGESKSAEMRLQYMRKKPRLDVSFAKEKIDAARARLTIDNGASAFSWLYSQINDRYRERIVGSEKCIFTPQKGKPSMYVRPRYLLEAGVLSWFHELHGEVRGFTRATRKGATAI